MTESTHWPPPTAATEPPVLAHFGWRLLGFLADVANLVALFAALVLGASIAVWTWAPEESSGISVAVIVVAVVWYRFKWEGAGGSPLRRAMGVWIVDETTLEPIGTRRGFIRALVRLVSEVVFYLGYVWMIWDPKRQTWHDKAVRSIVVKR